MNIKLLVIVPSYPNKGRVDYQFVHERVKAYVELPNIKVDVFCLNNSKKTDYVFEKINVYVGNNKKLIKLIENYDAYLFHFLNNKNGNFILKNLKNKKTYIWFHGSDCINWRRRKASVNLVERKDYLNIFNIMKLLFLIIRNKNREKIINKINDSCVKIKFIFVSEWLHETSEKDFSVDYKNYEIINNYIDTAFYEHVKKTDEKRYNILSINNYANALYAPDMIEKIILLFSKEKIFEKFKFNIYGDGKEFYKFTNSLLNFENVIINKGFLSKRQIKEAHYENGIFLYPKRGDSQGVSRCEAMASGLVPMASNIDAVSEFSPVNTSYLLKDEKDFIEAFKAIDKNPQEYLNKSRRGVEFIGNKCNYKKTIQKEIDMLLKDMEEEK